MDPSTASAGRETRPGNFAATRWTLVQRARGVSPEARAALGELCEAYYEPVHAFIRQLEADPEEACDLTQSFFAHLLSGRAFAAVEPGRGRFRSYLLGAVKHFLAESHRTAAAAKRGGGQRPVSLADRAGMETTTELQVPDPTGPAPDVVYDRQWAVSLVERAGEILAAEYEASQGPERFAALKPWLLGDPRTLSQSEAAGRLGLSDGAFKVAIHRMRRRFRELVRVEIAHTVGDPTQIEEELRYLVEVLVRNESGGG
ncbi:MAG: sigma-70 family RNA polymerase sigma factor [Verrucomicrobiae bacterium]|nr:sigma-70 family RNA polymerase sigma factor [Verrucomicrobiae bacterium]